MYNITNLILFIVFSLVHLFLILTTPQPMRDPPVSSGSQHKQDGRMKPESIRSDIWICSHNMNARPIKCEADLGNDTKPYSFKLFQKIGLLKTCAEVNKPKWNSVTREFPNKWLAFGNVTIKSQLGTVIQSTAIDINLNCGFIPESYTTIPIVDGEEKKCILVVHGIFSGNKNKFTIANVHGDWNSRLEFDNINNSAAIISFLRYMKFYSLEHRGHFVLAGDFNINRKTLISLRYSDLEKIIPGLYYPTLDSKLTTVVSGKFKCTDHIITNVEVLKLFTFVGARKSDHLLLAFKISLPYLITPYTSVNVLATFHTESSMQLTRISTTSSRRIKNGKKTKSILQLYDSDTTFK